MYTDWPHNYAEYVIRAPALLAFAQAEGALDRGMTPVLALPNKLKADDFNMHMLRPFFDYEPVTFRDFSRPVPPETPSNHTAEGKAVRCFKNLIVARLQFGDYPLAVRAARQISDWFQKHHPLAVPDCGKSPPVVGPSGQRLRLECIGYVFGARGFAHDMGVLRDADVIVAFHGAGAVNTIFMQPHRSLVEVRPFQFGSGSKVMWWPNMWMPQIARQSGWEIFFWGVNVEDKELCPPSPAEAVGFAGMEAIRDRSVKLRWEWLRPAIESIAQVNLSVPAYVQQLRNLSFLWQVDPGPHFGLAPVAIANATLIP
ncbi:hypothetical protein HXX76_014944 [Chlamydomonas incerta]|uniref:Glycosyltransferase n=1 Tax=Chlamydomonas incerta TaxID=51695 RepID=A0A835SPZ6_CHLIN|nr:hypothetical protein HXX76_014944 [Chlamydomonas incerta]|eukprot:KAG2423891.1 hypothetical protein HXX76_014944 [Chlamydomonas incerta]